MEFDIIDVIIVLYCGAPLAIGIFTLGFYAGRLKERTLAQAAMINAMRSVGEMELTEEDSREIAAKLRRKMNEADEAWIPGEMDA